MTRLQTYQLDSGLGDRAWAELSAANGPRYSTHFVILFSLKRTTVLILLSFSSDGASRCTLQLLATRRDRAVAEPVVESLHTGSVEDALITGTACHVHRSDLAPSSNYLPMCLADLRPIRRITLHPKFDNGERFRCSWPIKDRTPPSKVACCRKIFGEVHCLRPEPFRRIVFIANNLRRAVAARPMV